MAVSPDHVDMEASRKESQSVPRTTTNASQREKSPLQSLIQSSDPNPPAAATEIREQQLDIQQRSQSNISPSTPTIRTSKGRIVKPPSWLKDFEN
jgi:hypothetical protein